MYFAILSILLTVIYEHRACAMSAHRWKVVRRPETRGANVSSGWKLGSARLGRLPRRVVALEELLLGRGE